MENVLITGSSGFIGFNLCRRLLNDKKYNIIGLDNMSDYYDIKLKEDRLDILKKYKNFKFIKGDIIDRKLLTKIFSKYKPSIVINLAAQAGVRESITNPDRCVEANVIGFYNILELIRNNPVKHLIYASSSSIYGEHLKNICKVEDKTDSPVSLYAATKKSNELFSYAYSELYKIPATGLRFFTVYGPYGRPDMAYYDFIDKYIKGEKIKIYNYGKCKRDFTYIDDVVECIIRVIDKPPVGDIPNAIYNIGNSRSETVLDFIKVLEELLISNKIVDKDFNFEEYKEYYPMQKGDVEVTLADVNEFEETFCYKPNTNIKEGLDKFIKWYKDYYNIKR